MASATAAYRKIPGIRWEPRVFDCRLARDDGPRCIRETANAKHTPCRVNKDTFVTVHANRPSGAGEHSSTICAVDGIVGNFSRLGVFIGRLVEHSSILTHIPVVPGERQRDPGSCVNKTKLSVSENIPNQVRDDEKRLLVFLLTNLGLLAFDQALDV